MLTAIATASDRQVVNALFSQANAAASPGIPITGHDDEGNFIHVHSAGVIEQDTGMPSRMHSTVQSSGRSVQELHQPLTDFDLDLGPTGQNRCRQ
jgi:hypothetical protein